VYKRQDVNKIEERILSIKNQIDKSNSPYEIEKLQERLGKMVGGVAIINVGGNNEVEMEEKKDRIDDALQATKAALEEGIVPGAGVALLEAVNKIKFDKAGNDFERGKQIIYSSCSAPFKKILENAGVDPNKFSYILFNNDQLLVPDVKNDKLVDPYKSGIIDPTKVVRCALKNAAAAAITLLMTEAAIYEKPNDKKESSLAEFGV
jgi:chaperonin GroEL